MIAASGSCFTGREEMYWAEAIAQKLKEKNIEVDMFMLPIVQNPLLLPEQMVAYRLLDTVGSCDLLLTIGYPAFVLKHHKKRVLLFSLASNLHEWFDTEYGILSTPQYQRIRNAVINAERRCLSEAERIVCASNMLSSKLKTEYSINSTPMILDDHSINFNPQLPSKKEPIIVCESTLEPVDRIDLLLNAVYYADKSWKLNLYIPSASPVYFSALYKRIERLGLRERVTVIEEPLDQNTLQKSSAYVALQFSTTKIPESVIRAIKSYTPLITASDCGAILEVVTDNENGLVAEPTAKNIAEILDLMVTNSELNNQLSSGNIKVFEQFSDVDSIIEKLVG